MHSTAWAEIDLSALRHNLHCVRELAPHSRVIAMIKADAYGHGLLPVARCLAPLADKLGVARLEEALALREAGIDCPLLLMGTLLDDDALALCARHGIALAVHSLDLARQIARLSLPGPLELWLKLDTGMNRLGLTADELLQARALLAEKQPQATLRLMTHFSSADDLDSTATTGQLERFNAIAKRFPQLETSLANSAGVIAWPASHRDWVRPGIMLYGDNPTALARPHLKPVMRLKSRVLAIKAVAAGDSVGYNALWTASAAGQIAAIGIGYGDGYPRQLGNGTPVEINGELLPLVGRISMDICSVDISRARQPVQVGDEVTLWGGRPGTADIATRAGTISYHLYTGVTRRVPRVYRDDPD